MPFWKLAHKLESLSFEFGIDIELEADEEIEEQNEPELTSFKVPVKSAPKGKKKRDKIHVAIATRTIIAAAKGGQLRHLNVTSLVQHPFAVYTLLPYWVAIESWGDRYQSMRSWQGAAASLRPLLAHCSLWLDTIADSGPRASRGLTRQDLQGLEATFEATGGTPKLSYHDDPQPVDRYLPWLAEDKELAQEVADAWNAIVERGEADTVMCSCKKCKSYK